ncbi:hypothetical protein K437DRAFT_259843 [Tilletiaria anomala UBC 951]|uniref:Protein YOP1 n=1 Tax=Tilletiaria anomala (strain ATCC 24038 / CBS 436.72 / UBC 951) TaxID=1037660 RepID=A0A066V699_TILAU|nr:uncharacterized protein K437DRAFT_259843 [Tilletiaria anomala UBC 951]KDN37272.1 hypothetical protein K437DRAFT_259843 [Tilletiaria anomala UBC 951]
MVFFLSLPILVLNSAATFVYPLYASYKAITSTTRPGSTVSVYSWGARHDTSVAAAGANASSSGGGTELAELETWLMYWSVIACIQTVEAFLEWSWSWIPFYFELKLLFTLWLVLPQTKGATYLYIHHVAPFLAAHEQDIDVALGAAKSKLKASAIASLEKAWNSLRDAMLNLALSQPAGSASAPIAGNDGSAAAPPSVHNPAQGPAAQLMDLFRSLAPAAASGATAILDRATAGAKESKAPIVAMTKPGKGGRRAVSGRAGAASASTSTSALAAAGGTMDRAQAARRRAELEHQLAELYAQDQQTSAAAASTGVRVRRVPASLQPGGGARPRAASAAARASDPAHQQQRANRLVSQPIWSGGNAENDNGSDDMSDEPAYVVASKSEKSALSGSYAVLDKTEGSSNVVRTAGGAARGAALKKQQQQQPGNGAGARAAAGSGVTAAKARVSEQAAEDSGWGAWLRGSN